MMSRRMMSRQVKPAPRSEDQSSASPKRLMRVAVEYGNVWVSRYEARGEKGGRA